MQGRDAVVIVGVIVLVALFVGLLGGGMMMGPGMMGWGGYGFGFNPLWSILMLLFWALIIGGVVLLAIWLFRQGRPVETGAGFRGGRALDTLRERYARGEITREEYEQMRRDLE